VGEGTPTARRPRRGRGAKVISVRLEQDLLARFDALAKSLGISRALLIERGLKAVLAAEGRLG
jgi:predicted transcriptional regulator